MQRCLELAARGAGFVAPNPMVGAVLGHDDRIIGEGWHQRYGEAHAEVNCIASVKQEDKNLISQSTLYVSLEPCAHFGKTPPCADLIIKKKIPKVVIGCRDPFKEVDGKGIEKLKAAGVEVEVGISEFECKDLNKRFFTFYTQHRPFIILKWAQTGDGKIAASLNPSEGRTSDSDKTKIDYSSQIIHQNETTPVIAESRNPPSEGREAAVQRLLISNEYSNRLVHQWRSEEASILIGTNTALLDDPELTTRLWPGPSPIRLVVDMDLKLPSTLKIFNQQGRTIIFNTVKHEDKGNVSYYKVMNDVSLVHQMMNALYQLKIQSVLVEGGAKLLQSFIDEGMWDEARVIKNEKLIINNGLNAPVLKETKKVFRQKLLSDTIEIYKPKYSD
jgi:diaminohydroxyphosphoribosylaminopyrimidine deaminase/5-amino-6-(5-phosphoribosylamino)uracil reductase